MSEHTPGPWSAFISGNTIAIDLGANPRGERPCIIGWPGFDSNDQTKATNIANARLIAAAPDLLEALQEACNSIETTDNPFKGSLMHNQMRAAIAKATGKEKQ